MITWLSVYCIACTEHAMRSHGCLYTVLHVLSMLYARRIVFMSLLCEHTECLCYYYSLCDVCQGLISTIE